MKAVKDYISKMAGEWAKKDEKLKGKNKLRGLVPYPFDFKHNDDGEVDDELIALKHPFWEELALYREGRYDPDMFGNIPKKKRPPSLQSGYNSEIHQRQVERVRVPADSTAFQRSGEREPATCGGTDSGIRHSDVHPKTS